MANTHTHTPVHTHTDTLLTTRTGVAESVGTSPTPQRGIYWTGQLEVSQRSPFSTSAPVRGMRPVWCGTAWLQPRKTLRHIIIQSSNSHMAITR